MCKLFEIETDDGFEYCESYGQLMAAIGGENIGFHAYADVSDMEDNDCLCSVDPVLTAEKCGMDYEWDGFTAYLKKKKPA